MPLIMVIASRKFVFTMMDAEMLFITHVYQPIVAPPAIREDPALRPFFPESWAILGRSLKNR